ncbi:MAG: hypothetical protein JO000_00040 [Alphaproteobacteria bacterium]|nr:hypothetical protein [Alphaproteobacteria bacterium]
MPALGPFCREEPFRSGSAVTPSDATVYLPPLDALYVGGGGNLALVGVDGASYTLSGVLAGTIYNVQAVKVMATGTTAANIVALRR